MNLLNLINAGIVMLGIPTIIAAAIYLGRKLQVLDSLVDTVNNKILPKLEEIDRRLIAVEVKLDVMWSWFSRQILPATKLDIAPKE